MKRIPELQKLKQRIIALDAVEAERLSDWLIGVCEVRREDKKRVEAKDERNQK